MDSEHLALFFEKHKSKLMKLDQSISLAEREDLYQDCFVKCLQRLNNKQEKEVVWTLAYIIRAYKCVKISEIRKDRLHFVSLDSICNPPGIPPQDQLDDSPQVKLDSKNVLQVAKEQLSSKEYRAFVKRFKEGKKFRQIAKEMRCPESTVKTWITRGLETLRLHIPSNATH